MAKLWEITAGANERYLYAELNDKSIGAWNEYRPRIIKANAEDTLSLFNSPGYELDGKRMKGDPIASDKVSNLAKRYTPPEPPN